MAKKKYNPFKMWGSYVGAIAGLFFMLPVWDSAVFGFELLLEGGFATVIGLIFVLIGFLIGWGIHSLIRRAKK